MSTRIGLLAASLAGLAAAAGANDWMEGRPTLELDGNAAKVVIDLGGGSIADFHLKEHKLNPISWDSWSFSENPDDKPPMEPRSMGHFLCLDRWGPASEAEIANGMGWHGEATRVDWKVTEKAKERSGKISAAMEASLPMAGLAVRRVVSLDPDGALLLVREEVTNTRPLGRIYNMVQHPSIGPPFLDESTVVDANGRKGFMQGGSLPYPEEPSVYWPQGINSDGQIVNLRHLTDSHDPGVASYVIDEEYGWVTATNAGAGLLIGYVWKTEDYPWFDAWRNVKDGKPFARGLEFGTSGLHQPFPVLVKKGFIFDRPLYVHIDAGETQTRSYANFLMQVPEDFKGVGRLVYADGALTLSERGGSTQLSMEVGELFAD